MPPNSDEAIRDNGQGRATQAKPQAQGKMNKGVPP